MFPHYNLKTLRSYSIFSSTVACKTKTFVFGDLKPYQHHFTLRNELLCRHLSSEISANRHDPTVKYLINSCGLSPEGAISVGKKFELRCPETADSVLAFLRNHGLSQTQISEVVRSRPVVLRLDPEKILLPKLTFYTSLGVSREDLAKKFVYNPQLLTRSLERQIIPTYNFLRSLLPEKNILILFKHSSAFFLQKLSSGVVPNIGLLRELGMPRSCISLLLTHYTFVVMVNPQRFGRLVGEVKEMGFNMKNSNSVIALKVLCRGNKLIWNRSRELYRSFGWSEADLLSAFRKYPHCMIVSEKKLVQGMDFLVNKMGWQSRMIAKHPYVLCRSLEKRVIPRCLVVKVLLLKGLINENFSLASVLQPVEKDFVERFVNRYLGEVPQLLGVYQGSVDINDV